MICLTFPTVNCLRMPASARDGHLPTVLTSLEDVLGGVAQAGFTRVGIDGFTVAEFASRGGDPGRLATLLTRHGLRCSDVGVLRIGGTAETVASARMLLELAEATGAKVCVTAVDADPEAEPTRALLARCADLFSAAGVRMALEFLPYTPLATLAQARQLCAAIGWQRCGVLVDAWMFFRGRNSWSDLSTLSGDQVAYVQLDDAPEPVGPDLVFESRHRRVLPGNGVFDLVGFVRVLQQIGFDGPVSVEVLSEEFRALPPARQAIAAATAARTVWPSLPF